MTRPRRVAAVQVAIVSARREICIAAAAPHRNGFFDDRRPKLVSNGRPGVNVSSSGVLGDLFADPDGKRERNGQCKEAERNCKHISEIEAEIGMTGVLVSRGLDIAGWVLASNTFCN